MSYSLLLAQVTLTTQFTPASSLYIPCTTWPEVLFTCSVLCLQLSKLFTYSISLLPCNLSLNVTLLFMTFLYNADHSWTYPASAPPFPHQHTLCSLYHLSPPDTQILLYICLFSFSSTPPTSLKMRPGILFTSIYLFLIQCLAS